MKHTFASTNLSGVGLLSLTDLTGISRDFLDGLVKLANLSSLGVPGVLDSSANDTDFGDAGWDTSPARCLGKLDSGGSWKETDLGVEGWEASP